MSRRLEWILNLLGIIMFSNAVIPLAMQMSGINTDPVTGNRVVQVASTTVLVLALMFALYRRKLPRMARIAVRNPWLVLLMLLVALSILWSDYPGITVRAIFAILGTTMYALYLRATYDEEGLMTLFSYAFLGLMLMSLVFIVAKPDWAVMSSSAGGDWRGVFIHKNRLGVMAVVSLVAFVTAIAMKLRRRWLWIVGCATAAVLLWGSQSLTSAVTFGVLILVLLMWRFVARMRTTGLLIITSAFALLALGNAGLFEGQHAPTVGSGIIDAALVLGRDPTLSGRTVIWHLVTTDIWRRPFLGYGVGGYWLGWEGFSGDIAEVRGVASAHAHNGYLDTILALGGLGILLFVLSSVKGLGMAGARLRKTSAAGLALFSLLFIAFTFVYNVSETTILERSSVFWILYVASVC